MIETTTETQICKMCGVAKPLTAYAKVHGKTYLKRRCQECIREQDRARRAANPEKNRAAVRRWREANPGAEAERQRKYRQENADRIREVTRAYKAANAEKVREWKRASYQRNAEAIREGHRERRKRHPEQQRAYREANVDKIRELRKQWHANNYDKRRAWLEANADKTRAYANRRRALKASRDCGCVTGDSLAIVAAAYGNVCVYCGTTEVEHMDHLVPLSKGGPHCISNLRPSCASCNLAKFNFALDQFLQRRPDLSGDLAAQALIDCPNGS